MKMQNPGPDSRTAIPKTPGAMAKSLDFKKLHTALGDLWTQNRKGGSVLIGWNIGILEQTRD